MTGSPFACNLHTKHLEEYISRGEVYHPHACAMRGDPVAAYRRRQSDCGKMTHKSSDDPMISHLLDLSWGYCSSKRLSSNTSAVLDNPSSKLRNSGKAERGSNDRKYSA